MANYIDKIKTNLTRDEFNKLSELFSKYNLVIKKLDDDEKFEIFKQKYTLRKMKTRVGKDRKTSICSHFPKTLILIPLFSPSILVSNISLSQDIVPLYVELGLFCLVWASPL